MNPTEKSSQEPYDKDLKLAFDKQTYEIPAELDAAVLAAAKSEIAESTRQDLKQSLNQGAQSVSSHVAQWGKPLFAMAAALIIGVGIVPRVLQSPEATFDTDSDSTLLNGADSASDTSMIEALHERPPIPQSAPIAEPTPVSTALGRSQHAEATEASQTRRQFELFQESMTAKPETADTSRIAQESAAYKAPVDKELRTYHRSAENWLAYVNKLLAEGDLALAEEEYHLLKIAFPEYDVPELFAD